LVKHSGAVKRLYSERKAQEEERTTGGADAGNDADANGDVEGHEEHDEDDAADAGQHLSTAEFKQRLSEAFAEDKADRELWKDAVEKIASFGPRRVGANVLIDATEEGICGKL
jgi:ribosome assembly protein 1